MYVYTIVATQTSVLFTPQPAHDLLFQDKEVMTPDYFNIVSPEHCIDTTNRTYIKMYTFDCVWLQQSVAG
jgi:hypothetical protein